MSISYAYTSGRRHVLCSSVPLTDGGYVGQFVCIVTEPGGEIFEHTCPGRYLSIDDALRCARATAQSIYPPAPQSYRRQSEPKPL